MGLAAEKPLCPPEEYLRLEETGEIKHEYVDGEIYAMSGASRRHNMIAGSVYLRLRNQAKGSGCEAYTSDVKLYVEAQNSFYYPDAMLVCAEDNDHTHYVTRPCIVVEVISPTTAVIDRREKLLAYRKLPSLVAYLLVESDRRQVEYFLRGEEGAWRQGTLGEMDILNLSCAGRPISFCLDDIYEDLVP
ncbi:MAG: Uma2 family endonuclease [Pseudomonadota bacterium]|nr:Uma2 family endonuclease [Pseudomonadota bacterium]MDP1903660.1 Uma2 family endonuclease [Pseudomonadota bacterium]MDP2351897.1 Uma2 family endonuclease [Pseudomonadota bacterium]